MKIFKKTILLDLDGVLTTYDGKYKNDFIPPIRKGAKDFIKKLYEDFEIILFTTREKEIACNWLIENELTEYFSEISNIKKPAYLIIDNRCINFNGNYKDSLTKIKRFKVWYK